MFKLTEKTEKHEFFIIHLSREAGAINFTNRFDSIEEAVEREAEEIGFSIEEMTKLTKIYTSDDLLEAAEEGYKWPLTLRLVEEVEEVEEEDFDDEEESIMLAPEYAMNEKFIIHHGEYDTNYSEYSTPEEAWEEEVSHEAWVGEACAEECVGIAAVKAAWLESCSTYTRSEVIEAAKEGYGWPFDLGLVVEA